MKTAKNRQKKEGIVTKKLDKSKSSYYKRYKKVFTVIVSTIIVFLVFNPFFQMKKSLLLALGLATVTTASSCDKQESDVDMLNEQASKARKIDATVNTTEVDVNTTIAPVFENDAELPETEDFDTPKKGEPTPKTEPQKKVYKYFWNKDKWTYAAMNVLKPLEIKSYLAKAGVDVTVRADFMDAYSYFKDLKVAKHTQETVQLTESWANSK